MKNRTGEKMPDKTPWRRLAPPLAFALALCLLVVCCYDSGYSGLPPTEKRYAAAKASAANLKKDEKKSMLRQPWEQIAEEFRSIYNEDPAWPNRPAALFRAAEALEELAGRSFARADARQAINVYETLALRHASSRLADDALFRAARMRAAWLKDEKGALALLDRLKKQYPKGDMTGEALALEKALRASANGKTAPEALKAVSRAPKEIQEDQPSKKGNQAKTAPKNFAGDLPLRYRAAKTKMDALRTDKIKACWRQPWEELREEFLEIRKSGKSRIAPGALYHAALCQQSIAGCSRLSRDSKKAAEMFISVSREFPNHALADDALLNAAIMHKSLPNATAQTAALLERMLAEYPGGDMVPQARQMLATIQGETQQPSAAPVARKIARAQSSKTEKPELQVLSWDSPSKNSVEIVLEMSSPTRYTTHLLEAAKGKPARLLLNLENASAVSDVRKGVTVEGSLLQAVRVRDGKNGDTMLQFDFRDVKRFNARSEDEPCRIVLSVASGNARLPDKNSTASYMANKTQTRNNAKKNANPKIRQVANMASQLGLMVQKVFIDAGHGGKDPGTNHNKIMERLITLDVATTLGRMLEANGLEVVYSRTKDKTVQLSDRTRLANAAKADLFVSIHVNAHENPAVNGFETYYLDLASNSQAARVAMVENAASDRRLADMQSMLAEVMLNARADESRRLATDIQRISMFRLKKRDFSPRDNGVKSAPFHVLLGAKMPAVLVEIGYCSNSAEAANLAIPRYRHAIAEGLAEGILAYRNRLRNNRTANNSQGNTLTETGADAM